MLVTALLFPSGRLGNWSTEKLVTYKGTELLVSEPRRTDFKLGHPRMMMSSDISAHSKELGIQSFGVARKDGSRKIGKEIVGLQQNEAGQGAGPLLLLPRPSQCLRTVREYLLGT